MDRNQPPPSRVGTSSAMFARTIGLVFAVAAAACSTSSGNGAGASSSSSSSSGDAGSSGLVDANDPEGQAVTCQNDPRVDAYVANLAKTSTDSTFKVTLVSSDPAPPSVGTVTWMIRVTDTSGAPMTNAPVGVATWMPDHGHTSSVRAVVTPQADGMYKVTPLYLFMPGVWRVTFSLPGSDAAPPESAVFFFCVAG